MNNKENKKDKAIEFIDKIQEEEEKKKFITSDPRSPRSSLFPTLPFSPRPSCRWSTVNYLVNK
jgi:hypothetical protein